MLIDLDNPASIRVAEKAGDVREGVLRSLHLKQDRRGDTALYSRLPSDPEPAAQRAGNEKEPPRGAAQ